MLRSLLLLLLLQLFPRNDDAPESGWGGVSPAAFAVNDDDVSPCIGIADSIPSGNGGSAAARRGPSVVSHDGRLCCRGVLLLCSPLLLLLSR